ncbi:MAG: type IV secretory system conjugative DNA transfer family protein [Oligoflexia bacterium]|nr:type IV secretory system conjugative DNA transfer family protein [Oligoflexia bacterium]
MLRLVEEFLVAAIAWFYGLPYVWGLLIFGAPALLFIILQFIHRGRSIVPGILGLIFSLACFLHVFDHLRVLAWMHYLQTFFNVPHASRGPIPILEPIFSLLIAPYEYRGILEETFVVVFLVYAVMVLRLGYKGYKITGRVLGEFSIGPDGKARRPERSSNNELGSGDLANSEQIARWTKPTGKYDTILNVTDLRGSGGTLFKSAKLVIPSGERNRHILNIAKTGSGKTTKFILPVLYSDCMDPDRSTIVIDSKPEMWRKLAAMTRKYNPGKNILLFNPLDTARSLSWNILSKIEDDTDCKLIAQTIIMATDQPQAKSDSPFFRNNALAILNAIMSGLLHDPKETLSMPRIHELVQGGMKPLCAWLEAHPHALRNTRTFIELARSGSQNADTIMSELSMRLSAWDLPDIRATTATSELDIEDLISKPTLFIVELRESELEMLRPMANVIVVELLRFLTKRAETCPGSSLPRPVGLVIDEFASALGRLPDIHVKLNTLRSRNVSIVAAIQSVAQVKANYGDDADSVLAGFSTKILMPALDLQDQEWASKETGQMTIRFKTATLGMNKKMIEFFGSKNDSTQEQVQQRAVLTPDEIGRPADNISTFFMPNTPVFQGHLVPYYQIPEMKKRLAEFDSEELELRLRAKPIHFEEKLPEAPAPGAAAAGGAAPMGAIGAPGALPAGITNTKGWTDQQIIDKLNETKKKLDWDNTTGSARKWWEAFENENKHRIALVLRLAEELANRKATITEFFLAYVYSNTDNIQANLCYLDYSRLKKEEEKKKREAAQKAKEAQANAAGSSIASGAPNPFGTAGPGVSTTPATAAATSPGTTGTATTTTSSPFNKQAAA